MTTGVDWRPYALRALTDAGANVEQVRGIDTTLSQLERLAAAAAVRDPFDPSLKDVVDRFESLSEQAKKLSRLMHSLSDEEIDILHGDNPFGDWSLDDSAMSRIADEFIQEIAQPTDESPAERSERLLQVSRSHAKLRNRISRAAGNGILYLDRLPPLRPEFGSAPGASSDPLATLAGILGRVAEGANLRSILLQKAVASKTGRGRLSDRLGVRAHTAFLRSCALVFLERGLPIKDSGSGHFFKFCEAIISPKMSAAKFNRDRRFSEVCENAVRMPALQREIEKLQRARRKFTDADPRPAGIDQEPWVVRAVIQEKVNALSEELGALQAEFGWYAEIGTKPSD